MFFRSSPRAHSNNSENKSMVDSDLNKTFVSDFGSFSELDETTISQRRILCADDSIIGNMDLSNDTISIKAGNLGEEFISDTKISRDTTLSNSINSEEFLKNNLRSKSQIFKIFGNPPLPPSKGPEENLDKEEEMQQHQMTYNIENEQYIDHYVGPSETNYYRSEGEYEFQYDSIDYDLYEEGPILNAENYINSPFKDEMYPTFSHADSGYNSPQLFNRSGFSYDYENDYFVDSSYSSDMVHSTNSDEIFYYFEDYKNPLQTIEKKDQDVLRTPINFQPSNSKNESLIAHTKTSSSGTTKNIPKIIFLGVEKANPAQYVAKYGPNLINLSDNRFKFSRSSQNLKKYEPSVKFYKLSAAVN